MAGAHGGGYSILQGPLGSYGSHVCASSFRICLLAGACAVQVCCSQSLPPFGKYGFVVHVVSIFYLYSQLLLFVIIPLIFQCDGAGWLPLTGLPWFRTSLGSLHLWRHRSFRHQPPSSSTDDEFNYQSSSILGQCHQIS